MKLSPLMLLCSSLTAASIKAFAPKPTTTLSRIITTTTSNHSSNMQRRMVSNILDLLMGAPGGGELVSPENALKGRSNKMANIDNLRHAVLGNKLTEVPEGYAVAVYGSGCFWGSEKGQWRFPKGIHSTAVGYCAGFTPNPTYEEACSGQTGHTEGVRCVYNPEEVSLTGMFNCIVLLVV